MVTQEALETALRGRKRWCTSSGDRSDTVRSRAGSAAAIADSDHA